MSPMLADTRLDTAAPICCCVNPASAPDTGTNPGAVPSFQAKFAGIACPIPPQSLIWGLSVISKRMRLRRPRSSSRAQLPPLRHPVAGAGTATETRTGPTTSIKKRLASDVDQSCQANHICCSDACCGWPACRAFRMIASRRRNDGAETTARSWRAVVD